MLAIVSTPAIMAALICSGVRLGFEATMRAARPPPAPAASEVDPTDIATSTHGLQHSASASESCAYDARAADWTALEVLHIILKIAQTAQRVQSHQIPWILERQ